MQALFKGLDEVVDVILGSVERAHPPYHIMLFVPEVEEVVVEESVPDVVGEFYENAVGLDGVHDFGLRDGEERVVEELSHVVAVCCVALPDTGGEISIELDGHETHLAAQLSHLLAAVFEVDIELGIENHGTFAHEKAVFGTAERETVDTAVGGHLAEGAAESDGGIGEAGTVEVEIHVVGVCEIGEGTDFVKRIECAEFGGLRDADGTGLGVVLKTEAMELGFDQLRGEFAIGGGHSEEAAANDALRCTTLVDVDVCSFGTDHGMMRAAHGVDVENVGTCAVEDEIDTCLRTESVLEKLFGAAAIFVVAIG